MEVRRRRRRVSDRHVVLGEQLQEALDARRAVVRTLTLVAVRQQQHDGAALRPLLLRARDEFVDDGLRTVDEVTELRLPQHERVGTLDRVAILEAHRGVLAEQRVVDPQPRLVIREVTQRRPLVAVRLVDEDGVTLHERAASGVLTGQTHRRAVHE